MTEAKGTRFTRYFPLLLDALRSSAPNPMRPADAMAWIKRAVDVPEEDISRRIVGDSQTIRFITVDLSERPETIRSALRDVVLRARS
jgi:hypothetical protein